MADDAAESLALFKRLTESLTSVQEKNDRLLEAVEIAESKSATGSASEVPLLKNLRARLSAVHAPNAALVRDLKRAGELFESKATSFQASKKRYDELYDQLEVEKLDVKHRASQLDQEVKFFEKEKSEWKEKLEAAKAEISEQNERLSLLSDRLAGTKTALESRENDLTNQRVLFEEERLVTRLEGPSSLEMDELKAQIKAQISRAMEAENARMKAELTLHQMREEMKQLNKVNERLRRETCQSRQTSTKTLQQFEKRTIEANRRLSEMSTELTKTQEHAKRFQELLVAERRKQRGLRHVLEKQFRRNEDNDLEEIDGMSAVAQHAYLQTLSETLDQSTHRRSPVRVEDILRKNEALLVEVATLKADMKRLRAQNADLVRKVKGAHSETQYLRVGTILSSSCSHQTFSIALTVTGMCKHGRQGRAAEETGEE
jgi:hypothetical protein